MDIYSYEEIQSRFSAVGQEFVSVEKRDHLAIVTMNDPIRLNCLSGPMTVQLKQVLEKLCLDASVRTIILTGADPAFSAGGGTWN